MRDMLRKAFFSARTAYTDWLWSPRLLVFGFVFMFEFTYFLKPMNELARRLGTPINILEPFCAMANDRYALPLIVLGFMVLISDFPRLSDFATFSLFRTGRRAWLLGQVMFLFMAGLTYIGFILASSLLCVMNNAYYLNAWSLVQKRLLLDTDEARTLCGLYPFARMDTSVLRQARPLEALLHGVLLILLFIVAVGCVQLLFALMQRKVISVFVNLSACAAGLVLLIIDIRAKWLFPISNAVFGWHYDGTYNETNMPISASYIYFGAVIAVMLLLLRGMVRRCSFHITGGTE
ncbi:MAG: hypothetical protein IJ746_00310 [Ruminococcus sp.]|nr:hypothetical protein [Ruminococcus sp.]